MDDTLAHLKASEGVLWVTVGNLTQALRYLGKGTICMNAHCGTVDFLVAASNTLTSELLKQDCTNIKDDNHENNEGSKVEPNHHGQEAPPARTEKPSGFLLQYRLRSTCQLPGKLLSSLPEPRSPELPTEAPEHNPEDGSIYALSEEPDVWVRGRTTEWESDGEARHSRVTSTAIFSGGRGHRRLGTSSAGDSDKMENVLLVWQLPLTTIH